MTLQLNGEPYTLEAEISIAELLEHLELNPQRVVVELNRAILTPDQFAVTRVAQGDVAEIIQFVGGG